MATTPKKGVHWPQEPSFGSPFSDASSVLVSTSSLDYINSQLVAHGFTPSPGLSLDGISPADLDRTVKCLLGLLSQRVEDMSRTEDLTTRLRTLAYDHERLMAMHRTATDTAANAEREANLHKSRLLAATRALQASESAHKHTSAELQRARTALQVVRATHQSELKKKEKDTERMTERWARLADMQAKLGAAPSGLRCANLKIVDGAEVLEKGQSVEELALEQAEQARQRLSEDNVKLRGLLLSAVNEAQAMLYQARTTEREEEPVPLTLLTLFPMSPQNAATEKLASLLAGLREAVSRPPSVVVAAPTSTPPVPDGELTRLHDVIEGLKAEIVRSQKESVVQAAETQAVFDQFAGDRRINANDVGDASVELMIAPLRDAEKERLEKIKMQLDLERKNFTEAALKLGQEKATLEAERMKLLDEKRSWDVERMLAELPPTPNPPSPLRASTSRLSPRKSPRKSPGKLVTVGKAGASRKTTRVSRRSSLSSPPRFQAAFETEVLPPLPAPSFTSASSSLLPTSFVLPPPSPGSAFPAPALLLSSSSPLLAAPQPPAPSALPGSGPATPPGLRRPFPMAKPFAPRMIHAYSPVKPSPLSRILMLANSPATPAEDAPAAGDMSLPLETLLEADEGGELFPAVPPAPAPQLERQPTLAEELGVSESPPESPEAPIMGRAAGAGRGRVFSREPVGARFTAQEKGKGRVAEAARGVGEKENGVALGRGRGKGVPSLGAGAGVKKAPVAAGSAGSRARLMTKLPPPTAAKMGPRRVLVDSAEAPAVGRGWRG
ncbi:Afadin and alpha-actinin-binding-domain-containing protein [Mycena belliarum]|uniref:Afadin and alpha-actinin-binding-domain-containing protein n=1 Tax=Mycena belliarum TaxID=1033014 RepID=A0AAD6U6T1_9AGAR|nr:Afadin and alpha-actinin-binding-domain-containing protein [Mycena belliae]